MNSKWNQNGIKMIPKCFQNVLQARSGHSNTYHISILFPNIDFTFVTWATVATYQRWTHIVCYVRRVNSQHNMKFTGLATTKHSQRNRASRSMSSQVFERRTSLTRKSPVKNVISIWGSLTRKFPVKGVPNHLSWKRQNGTIFVVSRIPS
jgi:hypothetical protein